MAPQPPIVAFHAGISNRPKAVNQMNMHSGSIN